MDNAAPVAINLSACLPLALAVLDIRKPGTSELTGWRVTFAGPSHPQTVAFNKEQGEKALRRAHQIERSQLNGRKVTVDETTVDEVRRENVALVVGRIVDWTPVAFSGGPAIEFEPASAIDLLVKPEMGWAFTQMADFLASERAFAPVSAA